MERPAVIGRTVQETDIWLKELRNEMRIDNPDTAYAALRAVLHELRDRLTINEAAQLAAQLPMLICGIYFDGWKPAVNPTRVRTLQGFLDGVRDKAPGHRELDPNWATRCVFALLARHVAPGEIEEVIQSLPQELRALWPGRGDAGGLSHAAGAMRDIEKQPASRVEAGQKQS